MRPNNIYAKSQMRIHNINMGVYKISPTQMYLYSNRLTEVLFNKNIDRRLKDNIYKFIDRNKNYNHLAKIYAFITDNTEDDIHDYFVNDCKLNFTIFKNKLFK